MTLALGYRRSVHSILVCSLTNEVTLDTFFKAPVLESDRELVNVSPTRSTVVLKRVAI